MSDESEKCRNLFRALQRAIAAESERYDVIQDEKRQKESIVYCGQLLIETYPHLLCFVEQPAHQGYVHHVIMALSCAYNLERDSENPLHRDRAIVMALSIINSIEPIDGLLERKTNDE